MSQADDILFAPIERWRHLCRIINDWFRYSITDDSRLLYPVDRPRPKGALTLMEFAESYFVDGRQWFWRIEYPKIMEFRFNGVIKPAEILLFSTGEVTYPAFGEVGHPYLRSIEDANLVSNTYTSMYLFRTEVEAKAGIEFVRDNYYVGR